MSSEKNANRWGVLAKVEGTYGADAAPTPAADGVLVAERPEVEPEYVHDGSRAISPGSRSPMPGVAPSGRQGSTSIVCEGIGGGAAYAASVVPNPHTFLQAAGLSATLDATVGSEKYTYQIEPDTSQINSLSVYVYDAGELVKLLGVYAEGLTISGEGGMVPTFSFPIQGIMEEAITDVAVPTIGSYPATTNLPPKLVTPNLSLNGVTSLNLRSFNLELGGGLSQRIGDNTTVHAGFTPENHEPMLELVFEAVALSTLNPYTLWDQGTPLAVNFDVGATQYERFKVDAQQAKIRSVTRDTEGSIALWTVQLALEPSSYDGSDHFSVIFD